ncbi:hypothetical protein [Streptomyces sp. NPDC005784]|uniref:hypothetical protein n=1 Tax=Streptomyces sp. NPDC005784 TaxID=3364731 RepID=UPI0036CF812E
MGTSVASPVTPPIVIKAAPGRRLIAAGIISRTIDVRITEAGVTGAIRKQVTR